MSVLKDRNKRQMVRLEGTNVELGNKILGRSGLKVTTAGDLSDAAKKIVSAVKR